MLSNLNVLIHKITMSDPIVISHPFMSFIVIHIFVSFIINQFSHIHAILARATSYTSQEPWPWNCESPNESVQRLSQDTSKIMYCGHGPSNAVWSHMWPGPQPNVISMNSYSCESSHMIQSHKTMIVSVHSAMVSQFCGKPTSKRWLLKIVQVTMKHDPFDTMWESM